MTTTDQHRGLSEKENAIISSWLGQKRSSTQRNYRRDVLEFFGLFPGLSLKAVETHHIAGFLQTKKALALSSQRKSKDAIASLLSFCVKIGYLSHNPAVALDAMRIPDRTAFRILSEEQVLRMITLEAKQKNALMMRLLYSSGLRVSELCALRLNHFAPRIKGVQLTVVGKGGKVRSVLIKRALYEELVQFSVSFCARYGLKESYDDPLFRSQKEPYGSLHPNQVRRVVARAAERAGIKEPVSPHWLRHCHATHALERGAPIHIVQRTLGHANLSTTGKYLDARPLDSSSQYLAL